METRKILLALACCALLWTASTEATPAIAAAQVAATQPIAQTEPELHTANPDEKNEPEIQGAILPPEDHPGLSIYQSAIRKSLRDVLAQAETKVLLVPCMVALDAVAALDRTERMLITKRVAGALEASGTGMLLDAELVARALGERRRRFDFQDVLSLALATRATSIVTCDTGYREHPRNSTDEARTRMASVALRRLDNVSVLTSMDQFSAAHSAEFEFDGKLNLPYRAVAQQLPSLMAGLGFEPTSTAHGQTAAKRDQRTDTAFSDQIKPVPESVHKLLAPQFDAGQMSRTMSLAFIASMFPRIPEIGAERVATKLLFEGDKLPDDDVMKPLLTARALYLLGRRPAALATLESASTPAELALVAILNGDLVGLKEFVPKISDPVLRLIGLADLMDVTFHYQAMPKKQREAIIEETAAGTANLAPIIESRLASSDSWHSLEFGALKATLDQIFPVTGFALEDLLTAKLVLNQDAFDELVFELAIPTHLEKLLHQDKPRWCCSRRRGVDEWDILNLIASINEAEAFKKADMELVARGRPEVALNLIEKLAPKFEGHPEFHRIRLATLMEQAKSLTGDDRARIIRQASKDLRAAVYYSGGQYWAGGRALVYDGSATSIAQAFSSEATRAILANEFPMRHYWPEWSGERDPFNLDRNARDRLEQATFYFYPVEKYLRRLTPEDAGNFLASLGVRFRGSDEKLRAQLKYASVMGDDVVLGILEDAIADGSTDFKIYEMYSRRKIETGEFDKARQIALTYPGFNNDAYSSVQRSNTAYDVGSLFFWRGLEAPARDFYERAVAIGSGSGGDITSQQRLALLDGDYVSAATIALRRANRYASSYAYRDYLFLLFALGHSKEAWTGFNALLTQSTKPHIWEAVDAGKRIDGDEDAAVIEWLLDIEANSHRINYSRASLATAVRFFVMDRDFNENVIDAIRKLTEGERTYIDYYDAYTYKIIDVEGGQVNPGIMGPSNYAGHRERLKQRIRDLKNNEKQFAVKRRERAVLPSDFVQFAQAYSAWSAGRFDEAAAAYEALAQTYELFRPDSTWMLPYFSAGLAAAGKHEMLTKHLDEFHPNKRQFDWHLSQAYVAAYGANADQALEHLDLALGMRPHTEERFVFTPYQWAQACEVAYTVTNDDRFRERLLDWARKVQKILPYKAWAYAVEAQYATDAKARKRALVMALYLDPRSTRLRQFDEDALRAGREADAEHNIFRKAPDRRKKKRA